MSHPETRPASRFSPKLKETITSLLGRYETKRSSILPILHAVQDERDWISPEDVQELERDFGLSVVDVTEVLTFYTMYRKSPPKPYRLEVCGSISCWLLGSDDTLRAAAEKIAAAQAEGRPLPFEVHRVECLGVCGYAPVALVNKDRYLNVTPAEALRLMDDYAKRPLPEAAKVAAADLAARGGKYEPPAPVGQ
ncbi:MAG: NAD(P)H-dependent oxidoreductase subunit E [Silvanigrellales bacterium]|nr:NAD(P)H-dependent oxidoreductase subunit E [Silvanigrellales bacterium]